jgi:hypothetical protein
MERGELDRVKLPSPRRAVKFYDLKSLSTGEGFRVRLKWVKNSLKW